MGRGLGADCPEFRRVLQTPQELQVSLIHLAVELFSASCPVPRAPAPPTTHAHWVAFLSFYFFQFSVLLSATNQVKLFFFQSQANLCHWRVGNPYKPVGRRKKEEEEAPN